MGRMLSLLLHAAPPTLRLLFVGNSLLNFNNVPETATRMIQSDGLGRSVTYRSFFVPHLEDVPRGSTVDREVTEGGYDVVVLQGAMVSSSLTRTYPQTRAIEMAKAAKARGARVILYVEWPRKGIDETEFTLNVYRGIAQATGAEILPVCYAWNSVTKHKPGADLWSPDGNHATPNGSYLAAACVYMRLAGTQRTPTFIPQGVDPKLAPLALAESRRIESNKGKSPPNPVKGSSG